MLPRSLREASKALLAFLLTFSPSPSNLPTFIPIPTSHLSLLITTIPRTHASTFIINDSFFITLSFLLCIRSIHALTDDHLDVLTKNCVASYAGDAFPCVSFGWLARSILFKIGFPVLRLYYASISHPSFPIVNDSLRASSSIIYTQRVHRWRQEPDYLCKEATATLGLSTSIPSLYCSKSSPRRCTLSTSSPLSFAAASILSSSSFTIASFFA